MFKTPVIVEKPSPFYPRVLNRNIPINCGLYKTGKAAIGIQVIVCLRVSL